MSYTFFLYSSPFYCSVPWEAYQLAKVLVLKQHFIHAAFFYAEAVWIADKQTSLVHKTVDLGKAWSDLAQSAKIPCYVCISSANQRAIASDSGADMPRLRSGFTLSSLTEFIALKQQTTKVLSF